jgi:hypothetical protein
MPGFASRHTANQFVSLLYISFSHGTGIGWFQVGLIRVTLKPSLRHIRRLRFRRSVVAMIKSFAGTFCQTQ